MNFLQTLLNFSERAARIARVIRQDPRLFALLVEEKGELEKNKRFSQDFKTLADVLIQESLRYYVAAKFPSLAEHVKGEETTLFTNTLGETIDVCVCPLQKDTASLLTKVLDGNVEAANILAEVVHGNVEDVEVAEDLRTKIPAIKLDNVGIWIDPIDSTSEYIHGNVGVLEPASQVYQNGLPCVTVLVGVYDRFSGSPIAGVVNQPFAEKEATTMRWMSRIYWGISYSSVLLHSFPPFTLPSAKAPPFIVISNSENKVLQNELKKHFGLIHATGAGYKGLVVALGLADAYVCSKGSTYLWDTCAPHGILRSFGGGIISYESLFKLGQSESLSEMALHSHQLTYHKGYVNASPSNQTWCNQEGIVVYKRPEILSRIYESLKNVN